jgi:F0F1-type ATP synthase assembly protein I
MDDGARSTAGGISAGEAAGLGLQLVVSVVVLLYLGRWLDSKLGTAPWFLMGGVFLGAAGAFWNVFRRISRQDGGDRRKEER